MLRQGVRRLFTTVRAPVTAELAMPERRILDTLTESGVAANRSEAVAWCIRLVGQHEADWLRDLHDATAAAPAPEPSNQPSSEQGAIHDRCRTDPRSTTN